ncbi:MAG: cache domain-containing protein, partial [Acidobacteriota bacterium]
MAKPIDPRRRFAAGSLGQRIFLLTSVLVILSVVASVVVARVLVGASVADQDVRDTLQRSTEVQRDLVGDRLEQLYLRALTVSGDPNFVAYLLQAIEDNDPASLIDQLDERQRDLGFDFAVVLDGDGGVVARTDLLDRGGDFTTEAPWRAAIEGGDYSADGLWARDEGLFYAVLVPLSTSGTLQGFLVAAYALGDEAAASLRQVHEADVVWSLDQAEGVRLAASTLGER